MADCAMWCTNCGVRLRQDEIKGWGCPKCGCEGIPCDPAKDVMVEVNWHELHILCCWAEFWSQHSAARPGADDSAAGMAKTVYAIARRLEHQWPDMGALTLGGEIAALPDQLAEKGLGVTTVESTMPLPPPTLSIGPGAVGFCKAKEART